MAIVIFVTNMCTHTQRADTCMSIYVSICAYLCDLDLSRAEHVHACVY